MEKAELTMKIATALLTLTTVIVGVWQFNKGQEQIKEKGEKMVAAIRKVLKSESVNA